MSALLLYGARLLTKSLDGLLHEVLVNGLEDPIKRWIAQQVLSALTQLILSNSAFVVLRALLRGALYVAYELGRDTCFSLILLALGSCGAYFASLYVTGGGGLGLVAAANQQVLWLWLLLAAAASWYSRRYILFFNRRRAVFDHEVGASLAWLKYN